MREINTLGGTLREQRLGAMEATTLLRTVMSEIDVAVFAFDHQQQLRLVNRAGERLLAQPAERLLGASAAELQLDGCLEPDAPQTFQRHFPGGAGRWGMRRSNVREHGLPLQLLVISDLTQPLREQELQAWQRLVRVLGHELNNSLTPIKSIAGSLASMIARDRLPSDWQDDMRRGLAVITSRSDSLSRFIGAYARLAKLPRPQLQHLEVSGWVQRVVTLETRLRVAVEPGPELAVQGDPDQLEQVLINLLRNAADAALDIGGAVRVGWRRNGASVEVWVEDDGPGLANTGNLFVPFFTTKPGGSGIGLVLSRQIAEGHNGTLALENRRDTRGLQGHTARAAAGCVAGRPDPTFACGAHRRWRVSADACCARQIAGSGSGRVVNFAARGAAKRTSPASGTIPFGHALNNNRRACGFGLKRITTFTELGTATNLHLRGA
jgi:two-component system, NtrC family, nitrogen regulation sensor histidine kinase NtrY